MAHEVSLGHGLAALPGWAAVGTGASQLCQVSCGRKGIAIETDVDDEPWWATGWEWRYLESVQVTTDADGAVLVLKDRGPKSMSIRLLDLDAQQVEAAIEPHRSLIDSAPPPPSVEELQELLREPVDDLDFQPHEGGIEIWFSDIVAHDDNDLVDDFVRWLTEYQAVQGAWREDRELVIAQGEFSHRNLKRDTRTWWRQRVPDMRL